MIQNDRSSLDVIRVTLATCLVQMSVPQGGDWTHAKTVACKFPLGMRRKGGREGWHTEFARAQQQAANFSPTFYLRPSRQF